MNIRGIYKTSLIDFPGKISTVLFSGGCNLRCRYCHNPSLACNWRTLALTGNEEALGLVKKRNKLIDGVTITGGEPTLSNNIETFIETIKELSLAVKIDTNGLKPEVIDRLAGKEYIDYAAVDVKTSPKKYRELTGTDIDFDRIIESIDILRSHGIDYEIRTTCVPGYVTSEDLSEIGDAIGRVKKYCLQQFNREVPLLDRSWEHIDPYHITTLRQYKDIVQTFADTCELRGI
jgi:pyruvate formate lyase activating enzyme